MAIKPDHWITSMAKDHGMIEPFESSLVSRGAISYGVSSYGYDFRVARHFRVFQSGSSERLIDPKNFDAGLLAEVEADHCIVPAGSCILGQSVEYFRIPRSILTVCTGKSTYARCGILVNVTPFEPEWEGFVTMSLSNTGPLSVKIYAGEGIAQLLFFEADEICQTSYRDRKGKYQAQQGIVYSKIESDTTSPVEGASESGTTPHNLTD